MHKGKERDDMNNYRPISLISVIAKIFERLIYNQLYDYSSKNNLLSKYQSGFRPLHSTVTALLDATTEWFVNMDQGNITNVIFLDLSKAFDTVDHLTLLSKLSLYGFTRETLDWFKSYLTDRQQQTSVNGLLSSPAHVKCGVPQGSILGPLLFLIYINDFPCCLKYSTPRIFADDSSITTTGKSIKEIVQSASCDLHNVKEWLLANKLSLNVTKTEHMFIGSDDNLRKIRDVPHLHLGDTTMKRLHSSKSVGVYIDERLSWDAHIDYISKRVSSAIGGLRQVRTLVPFDTALTIYSSLIQPIFD